MTGRRPQPAIRGATLVLAVAWALAGCSGQAVQVATVESVDVGPPAGRGLVIDYVSGACDRVREVSAEETPHQVRLSVVLVRDAGPACPGVALREQVSHQLTAPLGSAP